MDQPIPDTPEPARHAMTLEQRHSSGATQWLCAQCGRRTVMHYLPQQGKLKSITLDAGDEQALHSTASGGVALVKAQAREIADDAGNESGLLH